MPVYSTPVLPEPITIAGDASAVLYVAADVEDTYVAMKLLDVYPPPAVPSNPPAAAC